MGIYKSKVDLFYYLLSIALALIIIVSAVFILRNLDSSFELVLIAFAYVLVISAYYFSIIHPLLNTKYILNDDNLMIESGFYKKKIPLQDIVEISRKFSLGKEPALSLNRLYIKYNIANGTTFIGISPKKESEFMKQIIGNGVSS